MAAVTAARDPQLNAGEEKRPARAQSPGRLPAGQQAKRVDPKQEKIPCSFEKALCIGMAVLGVGLMVYSVFTGFSGNLAAPARVILVGGGVVIGGGVAYLNWNFLRDPRVFHAAFPYAPRSRP